MLDPTHAVVLVKDCSASGSCAFRAETSSDGGQTWRRGAALPLTAVSDGDDPVSGIAMVDATTLDAFGTSLWRSSDVGANWQRIAGAPAISVVAASAGSVWVGTACINLGNCASSLDVESSTGLAPLRVQPPGNIRALVRVGGHSYAVTLVSDASSALALSADGGNTWQQRSLPEQACGFALGRTLAVSPGGTVYMVCSLGASAGNEPKRLYRSNDDGRSWHDLGALETYGYADSIEAPMSTLLWRYGARAPIYVSNDAGRTWHAQLNDKVGDAAGPSVQAFAAAGTRALVFAYRPAPRPDGGWSLAEYRTADAGTSWQTLPFVP